MGVEGSGREGEVEVGGGALMSLVPAKNTYGFTWTRLGHLLQTSSLSSMIATIESPHGNTDLNGIGRKL